MSRVTTTATGVRSANAWNGRTDLVLVEQDVEITADVLPAFAACPSPWCTFGYAIWPPWSPSLDACGCARYSARLQREFPADVIEAGWGTCGDCRPGCWRHIDAAFLQAFGSPSCRHGPLLRHRKEAALASQRP